MNRPVTLLSTLVGLFVATVPALGAGTGSPIHIIDPVVRSSPPGQNQTAAYMILHNPDKRDRSLVKAMSPAAKVTELHTVIKENGLMKMRPVSLVLIKAGDQTRLEPGGLHIMLIGLKAPLKEGDRVALTLTFDDGSHKQVNVPVRSVQAGHINKHRH